MKIEINKKYKLSDGTIILINGLNDDKGYFYSFGNIVYTMEDPVTNQERITVKAISRRYNHDGRSVNNYPDIVYIVDDNTPVTEITFGNELDDYTKDLQHHIDGEKLISL